MSDQPSLVIVGAGFAGLATAFHLARRGLRGILVLEREAGPGFHASGRNAGMLRRSSSDEATHRLLLAGARAARRIAGRIPGALRATGSLILGDTSRLEALCRGPRGRLVRADRVLPGLRGTALHDPDDAVLDPLVLLQAYLASARRRGVEVRFEAEVTRIETRRVESAANASTRHGGTRRTRSSGRAVHAVVTTEGRFVTPRVVIAGGAWASPLGSLAGSPLPRLVPLRRHLFRARLQPRAGRAPRPFVWHDTAGVYARPEGEEFLLSPCDETSHPPEVPAVDPSSREILAAKVSRHLEGLGSWRIGDGWACLRTFAPDRRFVIGADPGIQGLFWVAGLGGHGMTTSWEVGRLAARAILEGSEEGSFSPARFGTDGRDPGEAPRSL